MKRIGVLTSGGDAPGMNAAIRAVVRASLYNDMSIVGFKRGYNGLLMRSENQRDDFEILTSRDVSGRIHRGGTFLMTARCGDFLKEEVQRLAIANLKTLGVEGLVTIGGNGTFAGAAALAKLGFPVVGIPGTIDNDLEYTEFSIGFDTAVNTACDAVNRIRETGDSHERASLVTVMGRDCGDIAICTAAACGAEIVMVPEKPWSITEIANYVKWAKVKGKRSMIMVFAEGAVSSQTDDIEAICKQHEQLCEVSLHQITSSQVALIIEVLSGQETRATVLGYTQRGGSPTARDRILAGRFGERAATLLKEDRYGLAVGIRDNKIIEVPIEEAKKGRTDANEPLYQLLKTLS
ncbi:MAG: ATP-dependent 6-phosphofructokinase [Christensenellales bacterium]|jgi:6-phosphofructokinase 1